jgi:2-polyprenyl-3-methyl-5-hydroxy-6-metoxy-1,4-benzoquinol methylase
MEQPSTTDPWYTDRLRSRPQALWKQLVPNPYQWNLRRLRPGRVLDIGCGVGRCLAFVDGNGVGIDHNVSSVQECRARGFESYTPEEFAQADRGVFDTILLSHVLEHLDEAEGEALVAAYLPHLRPGGRIMLITPQEAGQRSDPTHVRFVDATASRALLEGLGARVVSSRSFPLPRWGGRVFVHNETVVVGTLAVHCGTGD